MSLHAVSLACMQFHELACSSMSLHTVPWASMQLQKLECSFMSLHAIPWAYMQFNELACSLVPYFWAAHRTSQCVFIGFHLFYCDRAVCSKHHTHLDRRDHSYTASQNPLAFGPCACTQSHPATIRYSLNTLVLAPMIAKSGWPWKIPEQGF